LWRPTNSQHIIIRGIERKAIYKDDSDRDNFLDRLSALVSESKTGCYGWAIMTNHVPLLLKTGLSPVATVMRSAEGGLTGYAVSVNRRHRRHGHLFQNRYKSFLCELQISCADVARKLKISPATVSRAASRGRSFPNLKQIQKELIGS